MRWFVVALLSWIAIVRTDHFSDTNIRGPSIGIAACTQEVREKLSMSYTYLSSGRQAYVFVSEDGSTVLKLFRKSYYTLPWYTPFLPWKEREIAKREKRRAFYLQSYSIAQREFPEETGLLFVGCGQDLPPVRLIDRAHRVHEIDLNEVPFVLQKRGEPFSFAPISQEALDQFFLQIARRVERGVADGDQDVVSNFGWESGHLLHLDPGRLFYDATLEEPMRRKDEWGSATLRLRKWLVKKHPELVLYFDAKMSSFQNAQ